MNDNHLQNWFSTTVLWCILLASSPGQVGAPPSAATDRTASKGPGRGCRSQTLAPLVLHLPKEAFIGTPTDFQMHEHLEPPSDKPRPPFLVPPGVRNLALNRPVSLSDKNPTTGLANLVTDGDKEATDTSFVQMHRGLQWAQIDLGEVCTIYAIVVWHAHQAPQVYRDVVVQVANDPDFVSGVKTVYSNDYDNSTGLGIGTDKEYFESYEGWLIDAKGVVGRYVRFYSRGSTYSALNRYTKVEVHGLPLDTGPR